nr:TetR/AcrR family transcriptional regulator C-terminal domain-containing protein [Pseudomonas benzenivorans]
MLTKMGKMSAQGVAVFCVWRVAAQLCRAAFRPSSTGMVGAAEEYITGTIAQLDASGSDPGSVLRDFGVSFLRLICSADMVAVRRLMIAEADRSDIGKLFFARLISLRAHVAAFLSKSMALGVLRPADPQLAAEHLRALLEADLAEPLLLHVRESAPDEKEIAVAADRAVFIFLKAYAPD